MRESDDRAPMARRAMPAQVVNPIVSPEIGRPA
jgi:hypothetical protein